MTPEDPDGMEDISEYLPTQEDFASALEGRGDAEAEKNARENIQLQDALAELRKELLPGEDPLFRFDARTRETMKKRALRMGKVLEFPHKGMDAARSRKVMEEALREIVETETVESADAAAAYRSISSEKPIPAPPFPTGMLDLAAIRTAVKASVDERPVEPNAASQEAIAAPKLSGLTAMRAGFAEAVSASTAAPAAVSATKEIDEAKPVATSWQQAGQRQFITSRMKNVQPGTGDRASERGAVTEEPPPLVQTGVRSEEPGKRRGLLGLVFFGGACVLVLGIVLWVWRRAPEASMQSTRDPVAATSAPASAAVAPSSASVAVMTPTPSAASNPMATAAPIEAAAPSASIPKATPAARVRVIAPSKAGSEPAPAPTPTPVPPTPLTTPAPAKTTWM